MAKKKKPNRRDWYSEIQNILKEFNISMSANKIKLTTTNSLKEMVKN